MNNSSEILNRIMSIKEIHSDLKLSDFFEVAPTTINSWRTRNTIPFEKIFAFCEYENISLYYVFYGEGPINKDDRMTDSDCVMLLINKAMKETNITLTPQGLQKMMDLVHKDIWTQMKQSVIEALKVFTGILPSWMEKDSKKNSEEK